MILNHRKGKVEATVKTVSASDRIETGEPLELYKNHGYADKGGKFWTGIIDRLLKIYKI